MIIHVVEPGDSLYKIGQEYGVSPYRLAIDNGIEYNSTLVIGQTVVVQFPTGSSYRKTRGILIYHCKTIRSSCYFSLSKQSPVKWTFYYYAGGTTCYYLRPRKTWKF